MGTFILRRRLFSKDENNHSTRNKLGGGILLGTGAAVGGLGGTALYGLRNIEKNPTSELAKKNKKEMFELYEKKEGKKMTEEGYKKLLKDSKLVSKGMIGGGIAAALGGGYLLRKGLKDS